MISSGRFLLLLLVIAQSCIPGECRVQIIGRRKNVEYMGQNDGGACSVCNDGHDLCCPQFTIPLDSSDAFTGPLPSLTIPTGMNSGSLRIRFGFFTFVHDVPVESPIFEAFVGIQM